MPSGAAKTRQEKRAVERTHHLRRDPAAEIGADQHSVIEAQLAGEVEIQLGHVVDAARTAVDQRRRAISGMRQTPSPPAESRLRT
jgi:hypothetical protein